MTKITREREREINHLLKEKHFAAGLEYSTLERNLSLDCREFCESVVFRRCTCGACGCVLLLRVSTYAQGADGDQVPKDLEFEFVMSEAC